MTKSQAHAITGGIFLLVNLILASYPVEDVRWFIGWGFTGLFIRAVYCSFWKEREEKEGMNETEIGNHFFSHIFYTVTLILLILITDNKMTMPCEYKSVLFIWFGLVVDKIKITPA